MFPTYTSWKHQSLSDSFRGYERYILGKNRLMFQKHKVRVYNFNTPTLSYSNTSHRAFTFSKSTKETLEKGVVIDILLVSLLLTLNIFHTFTYSFSVTNTFTAKVPLLYPQKKVQKTRDFLIFSGDIEASHWLKIG